MQAGKLVCLQMSMCAGRYCKLDLYILQAAICSYIILCIKLIVVSTTIYGVHNPAVLEIYFVFVVTNIPA